MQCLKKRQRAKSRTIIRTRCFKSLEEGYKAMANDAEQEKEALEWISAECGECLPKHPEDWGGWDE